MHGRVHEHGEILMHTQRIREAGFAVEASADGRHVLIQPADKLDDKRNAYIVANKAAILAELAEEQGICVDVPAWTVANRNAVMQWLDSIGETNPDIIEEVLGRCARFEAPREYFLMRAGEARVSPLPTPFTR